MLRAPARVRAAVCVNVEECWESRGEETKVSFRSRVAWGREERQTRSAMVIGVSDFRERRC